MASPAVPVAGKAAAAAWPAAGLAAAAFLIGWSAEAAQFLIGQGPALALLALAQGIPEFSIEAAIAWRAGGDPGHDTSLALANLTGSLRLLTGFAWPVIFTLAGFFEKRRSGRFPLWLSLAEVHAVELCCLAPAAGWGAVLLAKGTLTLLDSAALLAIYGAYLLAMRRLRADAPDEEAEDLPGPVRRITALPPRPRLLAIAALMAAGMLLLRVSIGPFLASIIAAAAALGIPAFAIVQWVAPVLSEMPEQLTAYNWARRAGTAPLALMNLVSANISQWTLMPALIPAALSLSALQPLAVTLDPAQRLELALTLAQSLLALLMIWKLRLHWGEAVLLFGLWAVPFIHPAWREEALWAYGLACAGEFAYLLAAPGPRAHRVVLALVRLPRRR